MPSISVPLKDHKGWDTLMKQRRDWWAKNNRNQLTPHFKATEFYTHDGSAVPIVARPALIRLCKDFLEPLRAKFGEVCFVLSGYRHELYNQQIGGARFSQHVYENNFESVAADLRFPKGTPAQWGAEAKRLRTKHGGKGGVGIYPRSGFIHVDNRNYKADWSQ
jgi:Peptidase M15